MVIQKILVIITFVTFVILFLANTPNISAIAYDQGHVCVTSSECADSLFCKPLWSGSSGSTCEPLISETGTCIKSYQPNSGCQQGLECQLAPGKTDVGTCQKISVSVGPGTTTSGIGKIFGSITAPDAISKFGGQDATGTKGLGMFFSNLIVLIYIFAAIGLLFMLLWGAFDWITSEGEKEKVNSARNKIINAIIGLILFSVAFAFLRILGTFTGFEFFKQEQCCPTGWVEQNYRCVFLDDQNRVLYSRPTSCTK